MQTSATPSLSVIWVQSFLEKHAHATPVLLAVSGGLDSMVLWDLVHKSGYSYAVAHVNYHLRGADSDADAQLVTEIAAQRGVELHVHDDRSLNKNSAGLQAHARDVRYQFFEKLSDAYTLVCTAHHADDQVETVLLQLGRGGGPTALAGISSASEERLRPLLPFSKASLSAYAKTHAVAYREDQSNATDHYLRNRIRHHLAPVAEEMFDGFRQNLGQAASQQQELLSFAASMVTQKVNEVRSVEWPHALDRAKLAKVEGLGYIIHELLRKHEFASVAVRLIAEAIDDEVLQKRQFLNRDESVRLVLTGHTLHLEHVAPLATFEIELSNIGDYASPLGQLTITKSEQEEGFTNRPVDHQGSSGAARDEIWVESLTDLIWRTTKNEDSLKISTTQTKVAKRVLAEAKRPTTAQNAASSIVLNDATLWIVDVRKSARLETKKAKTIGYRLRFNSSSGIPGVIRF
ncbi:MAG: tRNA lysidine(34) synthetase TilS [Saprospiraceae bacterium]